MFPSHDRGEEGQYALPKLFGEEGGIGAAFDQVKTNLGFASDTAGISTEAAEQIGAKAGTPIDQLTATQKADLKLGIDSGVIKNAAAGVPFEALANTAALTVPPLVAAATPEDEGSIEDRFPGFYSLYPENTYFGHFGNRVPTAADGS